MMNFQEYLQEAVVESRRQNMVHFQDMKPLEFIEFVRGIKSAMKGKLQNIKTVMKVDGLGARFGRDPEGRIFFEGSRTGPIFDDNAFSRHAISKGSAPEIVARAAHYDDLLQVFKKGAFMKAIPDDRKIVCEVFYNPLATEDDTGITFVTVKYDKSKLGSLMSILPYSVMVASTGEPAPDEAQILKALYAQSNNQIKVIDPNLKMGTIDIQGFIDPIDSLDAEAIRVLNSRKAIDAPLKMNVLQVVNTVKDQLAAYLLQHQEIVDKFKLGPEIEGIVLHLNGKVFKITTPEFKAAIKAKKQ